MIPLTAALSVFLLPFISFPLICTAVVCIAFRFIRNI